MLAGKGVITELHKCILPAFAGAADSQRFYLSGGTALAEFYLARRKSFDLDAFTSGEGLVLPFSRVFARKMREGIPLRVVGRFESFVEYEIGAKGEKAWVRLACDSPFLFAEPADSDLGIRVRDYEDLAAGPRPVKWRIKPHRAFPFHMTA